MPDKEFTTALLGIMDWADRKAFEYAFSQQVDNGDGTFSIRREPFSLPSTEDRDE